MATTVIIIDATTTRPPQGSLSKFAQGTRQGLFMVNVVRPTLYACLVDGTIGPSARAGVFTADF